MVTLKKLLLLMSVVPSVAILAMETASNNNNDIEEETESTSVQSSVINAAAVQVNFPSNIFNQDKCFTEEEWDILDQRMESKVTPAMHQKILAKNKLITNPVRDFKASYNQDPKMIIAIPDSDNPKVEKKNKAGTYGVQYEFEPRKGPKVIVRQYRRDYRNGEPVIERILEVTDDREEIIEPREVVATDINDLGTYCAYADNTNQICICNIESGIKWGNPLSMLHGHQAFETKYTKGEEKSVIKSVRFITDHVLSIKTSGNCTSLIHISPDGTFAPIKCFETPQVGTGWITGTVLGRQYYYRAGWEKQKEKENRPLDFCLIRTHGGSDTFDHMDRLALDLATNHEVSTKQALYIGLICCINKLTKENSSVLGTPLLHTVKAAYKDPILSTFAESTESIYKEIIEKKAKEIGLSLK